MSDDFDINAFLEYLSGEPNSDPDNEPDTVLNNSHDIIADSDADTDPDAYFGADEVDESFMSLINAMLGGEASETTDEPPEPILDILGAAKEPKPKIASIDLTPDEIPQAIDDLTPGDLMALLYAEIRKKRIAGHHLDSMNSFIRVGIKQIVTKLFSIDIRIKNTRDKTDEDKEIQEIACKVEFTDVHLAPPSTTKHKSGTQQMNTPNLSRIKNITFSAQMYMDAVITATAYLKNGKTKEIRAEVKNQRVAPIPIPVGSELCPTYGQPREVLKALEEDPNDPGGYFIVKGFEWTVDNLENLTNNTFHVYKNAHMNEIARGTFLSKPGDAFENSYQIILRYYNNGAITLESTTNKVDKFEIPYYLLFRALGMTRDRDIVNHIVYGVDNTDPITKQMLNTLARAFEAPDTKYGTIKNSTDPTQIIEFIARNITENAKSSQVRKDENITKYINTNILTIFDRYIFPHIGTMPEHRIKKLRFLGLLIHKLLRVDMEITESTDRDRLGNKRIHSAGTSLAKSFKTNFNFAVVQEIRKQLLKDFVSTPFDKLQLAESVKNAVNSDDLENMLVRAITTGNKTITIRRTEITNRVSSQTLYHKNDINVKSTLGTINTPNTSASKQNERADEMRRVHPTYLGYMDVSQSAESGETVGMNKQMGCTASICGASSSFVLKDILLSDPDIIHLEDAPPERISAEKLAYVSVNGDWVGLCRGSKQLVNKYRQLRRHDQIHELTTIVWNPQAREVEFWVDVGRLMRPLIIVYSNIREYIARWRSGDKTVKFQQWIKLTRDHIRGLQTGKITMDDMRRERVIEYIAPEEQENFYLAPSIDVLQEYQFDLMRQYTHCDIEQAIFGLVTLAAPMANHSNSVRNTLYTCHRKQSASWPMTNYPFRIDKNVTMQHYCERPLISTFTDALTYPAAINTIVALMLHTGYNTEDSVMANQSSRDCGMFTATQYNYEKTELEKDEKFGNPNYTQTMDIKKNAIYEYVQNGFIAEGTMAKKDYVLIVKHAKISKPVDQYQYVDKSIVYKRDEPIYIERVVSTQTDEGAPMVKVKYRAVRPFGVGEKACLTPDHEVLTRAGWKPIAEVTLRDAVATLRDGDLVYTEPEELHQYDHDGDLYEIDSTYISMRATPEHRMWVSKTKGGPYALEAIQDIWDKPRFYKKDAEWIAPDIPTFTCSYDHGEFENTGGQVYWPDLVFRMDDWLDFLGVWISDGNLVKANHCQVQITCTKERKIAHLMEIARKLGVKVSSHGKNHYIYSSQIYSALIPLNVGASNKFLPDWVFNLSKRQSQILLDSLISGDGNVHSTTGQITYFTTSTRLADDVIRLMLHCGWSGYRYVDKPVGYQTTIIKDGVEAVIKANFASWRVGLNKTGNSIGVNTGKQISVKKVPYQGKVYCLSVPGEIFMIRHKFKQCWSGNSSRSGNKGECAYIRNRVDMPFCEDGLCPDIIGNAHSIPTRMAVNQVTECLLAQLAAILGCHIDATCFRKHDFDYYMKLLAEYGRKYGGHRRMFNGMTGDWIDMLIFIGPTSYQRLQKFVVDEYYATRSGPTSALTHQPLDGKNKDGGLRAGEMEKDILCAHGAMRCLYEKFYTDSDGIHLYVCRICHNRAVVNEKAGLYQCMNCGDAADIVCVSSSYVANVFMEESEAMNNHMGLDIAPHQYSKLAS